jgi:hypothetical protein
MSIIQATWEVEVGRSPFKASPGKVIGRQYLKNKIKAKRPWDIAQVVEHLTSKLKALNSPVPKRKEKKLGILSPGEPEAGESQISGQLCTVAVSKPMRFI